MQKLSGLLIILMILTAVMIMSGCDDPVTNGQTPEENKNGQIKIIHAASSMGDVDFAYRDLYDNSFYALEYGTVYGYQFGYYDFIIGVREIRCYIPYTSIAVAGAYFTVEEDLRYTILAYDYEATINPELMVLADTSAVPDSGFAFVRFIHVSTDAPSLQILEQESNTILSSLDHLENSGYLEFNAGTYRFLIRESASNEVLFQMIPQTFLSGNSYSIVLSGSVSDLTPVAFNAIVFPETSIE